MAAREGYTALPSESPTIDNTLVRRSIENVTQLVQASEYDHHEPNSRLSNRLAAQDLSWTSRRDSTKKIIKSNTGLLLVMFAQLFFACMDVSVKQLHSLNEPVPTLEVRS